MYPLDRGVGWYAEAADLVQKCSLLEPHPAEMPSREIGWAKTIQIIGGRSAYKVVEDAS